MKRLNLHDRAIGLALLICVAGPIGTVVLAIRGRTGWALAAGVITAAAGTLTVSWARQVRAKHRSTAAPSPTAAHNNQGAPPPSVRVTAALCWLISATLLSTAIYVAAHALGHGELSLILAAVASALLAMLAAAFITAARQLTTHRNADTARNLGASLGTISAIATGYGSTHLEPGDGKKLIGFLTATSLLFLVAVLPTRGRGRSWIQQHSPPTPGIEATTRDGVPAGNTDHSHQDETLETGDPHGGWSDRV